MRRILLALTIGVLASASAAPATAAVPFIKDDIRGAFAQARVKDRPLLIYFHTTWCSWCREMEDKVFADDAVTDQSNFFVPLRINCDRRDGAELMNKYRVSSFPTLLVVSPVRGEVIGRLGMYRPTAHVLRFLQECLTPGETLPQIDARIEAGEHSPALLLRSADRHDEGLEPEIAMRRYEQAIAADADGSAGVAGDAHVGIARLLAAEGHAAGALEHYRLVLGSFPRSSRLPEAFVGALTILHEDPNGAAEIGKLFETFADRFPDDAAVLNDHARHLLETGGSLEAALAKARRAVALNAESASYRGTLATALAASGRGQEALEQIGRAIEMEPTDKDLRIMRLEILEQIRKRAPSAPARALR